MNNDGYLQTKIRENDQVIKDLKEQVRIQKLKVEGLERKFENNMTILERLDSIANVDKFKKFITNEIKDIQKKMMIEGAELLTSKMQKQFDKIVTDIFNVIVEHVDGELEVHMIRVLGLMELLITKGILTSSELAKDYENACIRSKKYMMDINKMDRKKKIRIEARMESIEKIIGGDNGGK